MISEAIQDVKKLAIESQEVRIIPIPGRGDKALLQTPSEVKEITLQPEPRRHTLSTIDSFCEAVTKWGANSVVFVSESKITGIINDSADRRDTLTLPLRLHPQFAIVQKLSGQLQQKQIVRLLRHDLAGCVPEGLASRFRVLEFQRKNDGSSRLEHGRESLGKSVEAVVNNAENIPESFNLSVPVFDLELSTVEPITVSVDIDMAAGTIAIDVVPGQLEMAKRNAIATIANAINNQTESSVFHGSL